MDSVEDMFLRVFPYARSANLLQVSAGAAKFGIISNDRAPKIDQISQSGLFWVNFDAQINLENALNFPFLDSLQRS
jgi:hypothetical protein